MMTMVVCVNPNIQWCFVGLGIEMWWWWIRSDIGGQGRGREKRDDDTGKNKNL